MDTLEKERNSLLAATDEILPKLETHGYVSAAEKDLLDSLYREGCDLIIALRSHLSSDPRCNKRHIELSDAISKLINDIDSSCLAWDFAEQHKLAENERMLQTTDTSENILNQPYDKKLSAKSSVAGVQALLRKIKIIRNMQRRQLLNIYNTKQSLIMSMQLLLNNWIKRETKKASTIKLGTLFGTLIRL